VSLRGLKRNYVTLCHATSAFGTRRYVTRFQRVRYEIGPEFGALSNAGNENGF